MARCYNPRHHSYAIYGERGICVCERWHDYDNFADDMGKPSSDCTIDRIDNDLDYGPDNCRWATRKEQARNRRDNELVTYHGVTRTLAELAETHGKDIGTVRSRLQRGMSAEKALETPVRESRTRSNVPLYTINGATRTLPEWSRHVGVGRRTVQSRIDRGYSVEQALGFAPKPTFTHPKNLTVTIDGKMKPLKRWAEIYGVNYNKIYRRVKRGWTAEQALGLTPRKRRCRRKDAISVTIAGRTQLLTEWCEEADLNYQMVRARIRRGWPPDKALELDRPQTKSQKSHHR